MASQLKRQLLAMNAAKNVNADVTPRASATKKMAKVAPGTNSKGTGKVPKSGGAKVRYHTPDKTGADRTPKIQSISKKAPAGSKKIVFNTPQPTGKKAPKGKDLGSGKGSMAGRNGSLWGL